MVFLSTVVISLFFIFRFANKPEYYDGINDRGRNSTDPKKHIWSMTKNLQSADFGLDYKDMDNPRKVSMIG